MGEKIFLCHLFFFPYLGKSCSIPEIYIFGFSLYGKLITGVLSSCSNKSPIDLPAEVLSTLGVVWIVRAGLAPQLVCVVAKIELSKMKQIMFGSGTSWRVLKEW